MNTHKTKKEQNIYNESVPSNAIDLLEQILDSCVKKHASDIHIDPKEEGILVRVRRDGIMGDLLRIPISVHEELISRLKIISGTRTDLHDVPQDGRFNIEINKELFSVRISFMPTFYGENAVLRLLPMKARYTTSFAKLGFCIEHVSVIDKILRYSFGMILVAGPTGSGKTTTLHTCLQEKAKEKISVIALEDPIEYEMPDVRQIQVRQNHGVTFANVLRSVLRQDPDVIMVGEIRDVETAQLAIHTALTGHLVFSTIHTNSAIETLTRLIDMKIDSYILSSTLRLIVSQRLVRTICANCAHQGCEVCNMTGYGSRSVIAEVLEIDEEMRAMISKGAASHELVDYLHKKGWRNIEDDAKEKIEWGITTKGEVQRVLNY